MEENELVYNSKGDATGFYGPDAVEVYRVATLASAIRLASKGICPTRGFTLTKGLKMATAVTKKTYRRKDAELAVTDLQKWVQEMKAALPHRITE